MKASYDIEATLYAVHALIREANLEHVLCGGLAASLYRDQPRLTADIDFLVPDRSDSRRVVRSIIEQMGLEIHEMTKAELDGGPNFAIKSKSTPVQLFIGRRRDDTRAIGVDFLLSTRVGAENALERGRENMIEFGAHRIPTITVEDLIIAKLVAARPKDLDDLISVFRTKPELDIPYLTAQLVKLDLIVPAALNSVMPSPLMKLTKKLARRIKVERR